MTKTVLISAASAVVVLAIAIMINKARLKKNPTAKSLFA